jgi:hypothetical protein
MWIPTLEIRLKNRIDSLNNDVIRAYTEIPIPGKNVQVSPFPITMYALATLDYISSLWAGWNDKKNRPKSDKRDQTKRMISFCVKFLKYHKFESELMIKIFRHKLMHTSEPRILNSKTGEVYGWSIDYNDEHHMKIMEVEGSKYLIFGIKNFIDDLEVAIFGTNRYLENLNSSVYLRRRCEKCLREFESYRV